MIHSNVLLYPYLTFVHQCNASVHSPLKRYIEWVFCNTCLPKLNIFSYLLQVHNFCKSYHSVICILYICTLFITENVCIMSNCHRLPFNVGLQGIHH